MGALRRFGTMTVMATVVAALVPRSGRILVARRAPHVPLAGRWEFPGGKVDAGEPQGAALRRELREEFGVEARIGALFTESRWASPTSNVRLVAYWTALLSDAWRLAAHDDVRWVRAEEALRLDLLPADVPIAERLRNPSVWPPRVG